MKNENQAMTSEIDIQRKIKNECEIKCENVYFSKIFGV